MCGVARRRRTRARYKVNYAYCWPVLLARPTVVLLLVLTIRTMFSSQRLATLLSRQKTRPTVSARARLVWTLASPSQRCANQWDS